MESLRPYEHLLSCVNVIKKSSPLLKRYLSFILSHDATASATHEMSIFEEQANDLGYLALLNGKATDNVIKCLLSYLPLFNKNINNLKPCYLKLLTQVYDEIINVKNQTQQINYNECYYLFIIASIHPSFSKEEQLAFETYAKLIHRTYLRDLDQTQSYDNYDDEGFSSHTSSNQQLSSSTKLNFSSTDIMTPINNNGSVNSGINGNKNVCLKPVKAVSNCLSAPPKIETNNNTSGDSCFSNYKSNCISSENEDDCDDDSVDEDEDDEHDENNNNIQTPQIERDSSHSSLCEDLAAKDGSNVFYSNNSLNNKNEKSKIENTTPTISINHKNVFRPYIHRPLSRSNGSEPSQYQTKPANADMLLCRSYGSSFELDKRNGCNEINTFTDTDSGMKDAPVWLKRLRLHKYTHIFSKMTYDEMMELTEKKLIEKNVTVGATRKILIEIEKLKERSQRLNNLNDTTNYNDATEIETVLYELCEMAWTPMKPYKINVNCDNNLALAFIKLLDSLQNALIQLYQNKVQASNLLFSLQIQLIDKLLTNPSFSSEDKNQMKIWRSQLCNLNKNLKLNFIPIPKLSAKKSNKKFTRTHTPLKLSLSNPHENRSFFETPINYTQSSFNNYASSSLNTQYFKKQPIFKTSSEKPMSSNHVSLGACMNYSPSNYN